MHRTLRFALVLALMVLSATAARTANAQSPPETANPPASASPIAEVLTAAPRVKPTPMVAELLESIELERIQIAEMRRALPAGRDRSQRLELQRRIERIKLDGEVARLRVQLGYAQREGRQAVAVMLEQALQMIQSPAAPGQPSAPPQPQAR